MDEYDQLPEPDDRQQADQIMEQRMSENHFCELAAINVGAHIEKKGNLSYLSWAWAVDQLLRVDPSANWTYNDERRYGDTVMVSCTVTAFGVARTMQLPVMDHKNKAIASPDAFQVNTAMQRCLVKAIALHGLGLYIYAGEDLPLTPEPEADPEQAAKDELRLQELRDASMNGTEALKVAWGALDEAMRVRLRAELPSLKKAATTAKPVKEAA